MGAPCEIRRSISCSSSPGELQQVAGVEADSANLEPVAELLGELDHALDALQRVVRIHQQDGARMDAHERAKGVELIGVSLNEAVRHGARQRNAVGPSGEDV